MPQGLLGGATIPGTVAGAGVDGTGTLYYLVVNSDGSINVSSGAGFKASTANAAAPALVEGSSNPLSTDLSGRTRTISSTEGSPTGAVPATVSFAELVDSLGAQLNFATPSPVNRVIGTPITGSSGNVANASAAATLNGVVSKTTYITGFQITASGATGALVVIATVAGVITGTMSYIFVFPAGVTAQATPLTVNFPTPIPASAQNTSIIVTLPASGSGGTNAAVSAQGYQL